MDVFTQLPLSVSPTTKEIIAHNPTPELTAHLTEVSTLREALKSAPAGCPPPPVPVPPQRSAAIEKMRAAGNASFRKGNHQEAINMYSHAITMALTRPSWEPAPLLKEELQVLFANRSQAHMSAQSWPEALADASVSVDFKRVGNNKAHWRKAKALKEMGRLEEAKGSLEYGLEFGADADLLGLLKDINADIAARK